MVNGCCSDGGCDTPTVELEPRSHTTEEKAWLRKANKLFAKMPETIGLYTGGGCIFTYARDLAEEHGVTHLWDGGPDEHGICLTGMIKVIGGCQGVST